MQSKIIFAFAIIFLFGFVYASASPLDAGDFEVDGIDFEDADNAEEVDLVDAQRINNCPPLGCGLNRVCVRTIRCFNNLPRPSCYRSSRCVPRRRN